MTTFTRTRCGHYYKGSKRITLETVRKHIRAGKPFEVRSCRTGRIHTAKTVTHALAYRFVRNGKPAARDLEKARRIVVK